MCGGVRHDRNAETMTGKGTITIIACRVGKDPIVEELPSGLKAMQGFVGGFIECVSLSPEIDLWCNDEFLLNGSAPNRAVSCGGAEPLVVHGDFFLASHDDEGNTIGLSEEQQKEWRLKASDWPFFPAEQ